MDIVNQLKSKNVLVREIPGWGPYLRHQWEHHFANHLTFKEKEEIHLYYNGWAHGYLWHIFSYNRRDCLKEMQANGAFNNVSKNTCYVFYQNSDYALIIENATHLTASDFVEKGDFDESDIFVVDKEFTWTYVNTHEASCGPYFCTKSK